MNGQSCCFTGHRKIAKSILKSIPEALDYCVSDLYVEGFTTFYTGGALGFDTLAAEAVLRFREKHPDVRLILALPCKDQTRRWSEKAVERYEAIRRAANEVILVSEAYSLGCMRRRNEYMVNHSSVCVCCLTRDRSGTAYTVDYAIKRGLRIVCLAESAFEKKAQRRNES